MRVQLIKGRSANYRRHFQIRNTDNRLNKKTGGIREDSRLLFYIISQFIKCRIPKIIRHISKVATRLFQIKEGQAIWPVPGTVKLIEEFDQ